MKTIQGERLIQELLKDPAGFCGCGDDYKLVQECFEGFPVEYLRPLLAHNDRAVRRAIVWPVSELGKEARPLIREAVPLLRDPERYVRAYALDIIAVCAVAEDTDKYVHVVRMLEDGDDVIRVRVMFLMSNADISQLNAAAQSFGAKGSSDELHKSGLSQLLTSQFDVGGISRMIDSPVPLLRRYGAIATWRCREKAPELLSQLPSSQDPDLKKFWEQRCPQPRGRGVT